MLVPFPASVLGRCARGVLGWLREGRCQSSSLTLSRPPACSARRPAAALGTAHTAGAPKTGIQLSRSFSKGLAASGTHRNVIQNGSAVGLRLHGSHLVVQHPRWPLEDVFLSLVWLRDHCRCPSCFNHTTFQRKTDVRDLVFDVHPLQFEVDPSGSTLTVVWHDGHSSEYSLQWLWENCYASQKYRQMQQDRLWKRSLWDARTAAREDLIAVDHDQFMQSEEGVRQLLKGFLTHGAATVTGVAATVEATRQVIERVGVVQNTHFGDVWEFTADGAHADTAYTQEALAAHTDGTYFNESPGVQVFHCLHHDGTGGETTLVDGFCGLSRLHAADAAAYELLSREPCAGEYRDRRLHLVCGGPVVAHRAGGPATPDRLLRLRFNPYDRAPARALPPPRLEPFYRAYRRLAETLLSGRLERRLRLRPGTVLFIDNWRVLHGRAAFTGRRVMCGGYVARSDVMSLARVAGLLL